MLKNIGKFIFMIELGYKYISIFKKTFFHPFITLQPAYKKLSQDRQAYSNSVLEFLNIEVEVIGEIPKKNKILYAINHRSLLDILVMENIFSKNNKNGTWIAKQDLFDSPVYGKFFQYSGCMSVDLNNGKGLLKFFKQMKKTLKKVDDFNIYIFPEGERNKDKCIKEFQSGAEKIAKANKLDIVPIFINDTLEKVFQDAPFEERKKVTVYVGDIITKNDLTSNYKDLVVKAGAC
ncbi:1-acyl-sn-glycerol-3-phosphate acyltransferase [Sulfurimonas sp. SAG-AH-194-I05]|nr:lysophospholipid acyltransferase family protein [Sulfurimonas sp. SAG-AH-194-I05]MDF1875478.1 1-acyl-sn-glycerol-3-phosphate acyltransferase [Sulfurimonas sp. SAG-AH-194-I05]